MSSGFVSVGTGDDPAKPSEPVKTNDDWEKAKQEIEANRRRREEAARQEGGKSLYDTLQANKAAKQDAFEESIRLKNQFRSLDEDEVEFLDSVLESTRAKEDAVRRETTEQLGLFRRQQEEADAAALLLQADAGAAAPEGIGSPVLDEGQWATSGRKRKKGPADKEGGHGVRGVKTRKPSSSSAEKPPLRKASSSETAGAQNVPPAERQPKAPSPPPKVKAGATEATQAAPSKNLLGLAYNSDSDLD
ncbi:MAG: hypothetical protein M1832_000162 [Thelocarpon impressellum]|nr:MAG: hypothetical protein M1832_000162 [Thelocarpon impressellum]